jgi:hypothetical protein
MENVFDLELARTNTKREIDDILKKNKTGAEKVFALTREAYRYAAQICKCAADEKSQNSPASHFSSFIRIREINHRLENSKFGVDWKKWPRKPGIKFLWLSGMSALHVAQQFIDIFEKSLLFTRTVALGSFYNNQPTQPITEEDLKKWWNVSVKEIKEKLVLPDRVWKIRQEFESLWCMVSDELDAYLAGGVQLATPEGEWSKPMGKSKMMNSLGMSSYKKFNAFAMKYGIREAGNRQTFQIRLDGMDKATRNKLERA